MNSIPFETDDGWPRGGPYHVVPSSVCLAVRAYQELRLSRNPYLALLPTSSLQNNLSDHNLLKYQFPTAQTFPHLPLLFFSMFKIHCFQQRNLLSPSPAPMSGAPLPGPVCLLSSPTWLTLEGRPLSCLDSYFVLEGVCPVPTQPAVPSPTAEATSRCTGERGSKHTQQCTHAAMVAI